MGYRQDAYQEACFAGDGGHKGLYAIYGLPVAELYNGITGVEQVIGNEDNVVGGVRLCCVMMKQLQNKYPSVLMKQPAYPINDVNGDNRVNNISKDIVVHGYAMSFNNFSRSSPRVEVATRSTSVLSWSVKVCMS